jgi:hypothetical protein
LGRGVLEVSEVLGIGRGVLEGFVVDVLGKGDPALVWVKGGVLMMALRLRMLDLLELPVCLSASLPGMRFCVKMRLSFIICIT